MKDDRDKKLHEALDLITSEKSELFVEELAHSVGEAIARSKGEEEAFVESAIDLDEKEKSRIEEILTDIFRKKMTVNYFVKPNLIGGFKISVGDWKLDATLTHEIINLKKNLAAV
jgi:F0F1-type ATP synthase delta subunit